MIFGLSGTLVDTADSVALDLSASLSSLGLQRTLRRADILSLLGDGEPALIHRALQLYGGASSEGVARTLLLSYRAASLRPESLAAARPFPGTHDALEELRASGHRMVVCTARSHDAAEAVLASLRLRPFFAAVVGGDHLPVCKPVSPPA